MENQNTRSAYGTQQKQGNGLHLPQCPHCGKKINPFLAWGIKSKGEFACSNCGSYSNIRLAKSLHLAGLSAVVIAGILLLIFIFTGCMNLPLLILMLVPFFLFTVISPFLVRLEKIELPGQKKKTSGAKKQSTPTPVRPPQQTAQQYTEQFSLEQEQTTQFQQQNGKPNQDSFDI